ncbi:MAG: 3-deoxy-8-phosphooctulonate synthase [Deltaproteobacteria bacterium GWC2_42_51]|nr:MAG: 3-deoxy-8-phosphooctulonate synthase [Deltaproteobacteria bacterium GWA2_42_85]OGP37434.1 MAG: 3-deoxy-8-phosphooctulonate synthase [Deltaproteobacteria bacterium GWC2_42_51]OGP40124.1 MAG: 3-deoxy-8-phosphooctulonate synthase [Deltaproteobacteria bacterium GWD2_42_10]OGP47526.1 MAG: 3-deoxy-8-phosphooctulonate synthase [Deltaproteobacteria bacterium GWF2_42_12]OGQ26156.1 MAG: 3-deoxy-8-phosphooctulonate synthase [Deltaproteobacteria bacterium RIFCSPHIGHO2_02_FULL_42_44]OGQ36932.1 MAG:
MRIIRLGNIKIGGNAPFVLIAGPCVIENEKTSFDIANKLKSIAGKLKISLIFKASYDKANRTSLKSYRGPGLEKGLKVLSEIKKRFDLPILTDVHCKEDVHAVAEVADIIQIPAFLCRQTDLIVEAAKTKRIVNIKKGQFLAPWDVRQLIEKAVSTGNKNITITERGASFGYNNLIVDFRAIPLIRELGYPVIFDATHSVQLPGGLGSSSGGQREMVEYLARAATAVGVDGIFMEVHPNPDKALCDGPNSLDLKSLTELLKQLKQIDGLVKT